MLVSWVVLPVVMLAVSAGCGLAVARAAGGRLDRLLLLPVGFATTIVVASAATAQAATAPLAAPLVVALAVVGVVVARDRLAWVPDAWAAGAALTVFAVFAAPVVLSGSATFTGYIQLDDIATWLAITDLAMERGRDVAGLPPSSFEATVANYLPGGYPIGAFLPLGLAGKLTLGRDIAWLFAPTMALTAALLALTLSSMVRPLLTRRWARAVVAGVAAQASMLVSYAGWGAMKEVTAALLVALVAALAPTLGGSLRGLGPLAIALGALVAVLSLGGLVYAVPVLLVAIAVGRLRPAHLLGSVGVLTALFVLVSIPSLVLARVFLEPQVQSGSVLTLASELGNLAAPLPLRHVLGIWPAGDFRTTPDQPGLTSLLLAGVAIAAAGGLGLAVERRAGAVAGYLLGGLAGCALLVWRGSPWVDAKAMATVSPAVLTLALAALAWVVCERSGAGVRRGAGAGMAVLGAAVLWGNVLGYANAYVAPVGQLRELEAAGERLDGAGPTLMTEYEPYGARHFLRDAEGEGASELRRRVIPLRDGTQLPKSQAADVTAFDPTALREYRSLVLRTGPLASRPPSAYRRVRAGDSYDIWQRAEVPPAAPVTDLPLGDSTDPAARPDCAAVRALAARAGPAGRLVSVARAMPVTLPLSSLALPPGLEANLGDPRAVIPQDDATVAGRLSVPADGEYAVWLGGSTRGRTTVSIDGRRTGTVRHRLNNQGAMMRFGQVRLRRGTHRVELTYADGGLAPGQRGQRSLGLPLGPLILAPREPALTPFSVPVDRAEELCGRRLDWIEAHAAR